MYFSRVRIRPEIAKSSQLGLLLQHNAYGIHRLLWDLFSDDESRKFIYREELAKQQLGFEKTVRGESIYYIVSSKKPIENHPLFSAESKDYRPQLEQGQCFKFDCRLNPVVSRFGKKHDIVMDEQLKFLKSLVTDCELSAFLSDKPKKRDYKNCLLTKGGILLEQKLNHLLESDVRYGDPLSFTVHLSEKLEWAIKAKVDQALEQWFIEKTKNKFKKDGTIQTEGLGFDVLKDENGFFKLQYTGYQWHSLSEKLSGKTKHREQISGFSSMDFCGELQITDVKQFERALFDGIGSAKAFGCGLILIKRA